MKVALSAGGELRFIVNGQDLGVAFTEVHERVYGAITFGDSNQRVAFLG